MEKIGVLGVEFNSLTTAQAVSAALSKDVAADNSAFIVTPNPEIVWLARSDPELKAAIAAAALVLPDGIGIIYGARILGTPLRGRVTGIGFAEECFEQLAAQGKSVFLLGAKPGVAETAGEKLAKRFRGLKIAGIHDGYFTDDDTVIGEINAANADFLLVCLGAPKQELWIYRNRAKLKVPLAACLGGALDVWAGTVKRAPRALQRLGLEWLYRLIKEPKRIGRMMSLPKFLFAVIGVRLRGKNG
ncbi:MAG: WecB/TagA/CpsF family glycosyltransferase [Oscillospiraceae bacterium]|nr:WecB/TagA/CpsF family glycosyltransferase [Oscillospiraceae bacterium]